MTAERLHRSAHARPSNARSTRARPSEARSVRTTPIEARNVFAKLGEVRSARVTPSKEHNARAMPINRPVTAQSRRRCPPTPIEVYVHACDHGST